MLQRSSARQCFRSCFNFLAKEKKISEFLKTGKKRLMTNVPTELEDNCSKNSLISFLVHVLDKGMEISSSSKLKFDYQLLAS